MTKIQKKALEYIEKLCILYENSNKKDTENVDNIIGNIYKYSHLANGRCKNHHKDWEDQLTEQDWEI